MNVALPPFSRRGETQPATDGALVDRAPRRDANDREPLWRHGLSLLFTVAVVAIVIYLWPASLGGSTRLVIVTGDSMEPTYHSGDLVVTRDRGTPDIGDTVVFAVPDGPADGILVIHRVVDIDDGGRFVTQGDNRDEPDQWRLTADDIVGEPLVLGPNGGRLVWFLQQWWVIAGLAGLITWFVLSPSAPRRDDEDLPEDDIRRPIDPTEALVRPDVWFDECRCDPCTSPIVGEPLLPTERWSGRPIDQPVLDDATAWLDEQLGDLVDAPTG